MSRGLGVCVLLVSLAVADGEEKPAAPKPVLVSRTKAALVHAVPPAIQNDEFRGRANDGFQLLFTSLSNGEMQTLLATGTWSAPTRRISYQQTRIAGLAADELRLYVAVWDSGRVFDYPPSAKEKATGGTYRLEVFWLADGSKITTQPIKGNDLPAEVGPETTDKGPLKLTDDGVSCYGVTFKFKDKELVK